MKITKLSILIPSFNEANTITTIISELKKINLKKIKLEIIVINDASTDKTLKKIKNISQIKVISHKKNQGKGAAIRTGLNQATGDYVLIQDADLEYDPKDIINLINPILEGKAEVVYGSRFLGPHKNMLFWHFLGNKFLSLTTNILYNTTLSDMEVCYKLIPSKLIKSFNLKSNRSGFEPEVTAKILKQKIRIYEVPISYSGREFSEGKKITWRDGVQAFFLLLKYRLFN